MSWFKLEFYYFFRRLLFVMLLFVPLAGCFKPLYGSLGSGEMLQSELLSIKVAPVIVGIGQERLSHYLRSELVYELEGGNPVSTKRYLLNVSASERVQAPIINTVSGRAESATLIASAVYTLTDIATGKVITKGTAFSSSSYDRNSQRFATLRAARDADIKVAKLLAEQIKTRLAAELQH